jgi:hypothetical protein
LLKIWPLREWVSILIVLEILLADICDLSVPVCAGSLGEAVHLVRHNTSGEGFNITDTT